MSLIMCGRPWQRGRWIQGLVLVPFCFLFPQSLQYDLPRVPIGLQWEAMISAQNRDWHRLAGPFVRPVEMASRETGIPPMLLAAVVFVESRGQARAISSAGAIGPMQLMPTTAMRVLHVNPWQIQQNILGGAVFLQDLLKRFHGNLTLALEAYNAGPTRVASGEPLPPSAVAYAKTVEALLQWAKAGTQAAPLQSRATTQL